MCDYQFTLMLNGSPSPLFTPKRGLRQGYPLSLLLFTLCMEYGTRTTLVSNFTVDASLLVLITYVLLMISYCSQKLMCNLYPCLLVALNFFERLLGSVNPEKSEIYCTGMSQTDIVT